ncbi:MAG: hypothetical protein K2X86_05320 [Cytophagaceae bacterium]|nr:hypothetical protein [Cytophagaceae bacterium]
MGLFKDIKEGVKKALHKNERPEPEKEKVNLPNENHTSESGKEKEVKPIPGTYDKKEQNIGEKVFEKTGSLREGIGQSSTTLKPQEKPVKTAHGTANRKPAKKSTNGHNKGKAKKVYSTKKPY